MAQVVKHPTLDLSAGLDLRVVRLSPVLGTTLGMELTLKKKFTTLLSTWIFSRLWWRFFFFKYCKS